jgi:hypothetical protein
VYSGFSEITWYTGITRLGHLRLEPADPSIGGFSGMLGAVEVRVSPQPGPVEGTAIVEALDRLLAPDARPDTPPPPYRSAWRAAGVRENTDPGG